jgi:hypothetical protein
MNAVADFPPGFQRRLEIEPLNVAHRAIHSYPRHNVERGEETGGFSRRPQQATKPADAVPPSPAGEERRHLADIAVLVRTGVKPDDGDRQTPSTT